MIESAFVATAKTILDNHIANKYKLKIIGRKRVTTITMVVTLAVIIKEGDVPKDLILDLIDEQVRQDSDIELTETRIDLDNLDSEILLLEAEVTYSKD